MQNYKAQGPIISRNERFNINEEKPSKCFY